MALTLALPSSYNLMDRLSHGGTAKSLLTPALAWRMLPANCRESMIRNLLVVCVGASLTLGLLSAHGAEKPKVDLSKIPPAAARTGVTYATDIKPIFDNTCVRCHGAEKPKARLRLDSLAGVLKGGEGGKVVLPGESAGSRLVHNVAHAGIPDDFMPPPRNKANIPPLTKEQIGLIRAWIDQGAK
jgi:mono/diheme cytochrome c family protein